MSGDPLSVDCPVCRERAGVTCSSGVRERSEPHPERVAAATGSTSEPAEEKFRDEYGNRMGWCNACGEEAPLYGECEQGCEDGEVVPYDDDPEEA